MVVRKVFCEVLDGVTYSDRCLFKLSKIIEGNKFCEECLLRELERMKKGFVKEDTAATPGKKGHKKRPKAAGRISKDWGDIKVMKDINISLDIKDTNISPDIKEALTVKGISELIGKSRRRVQELAKQGKIPAFKSGSLWFFNREEVDHWFSKKEHLSPRCHDVVMTNDLPSPGQEESGTDASGKKGGEEETGDKMPVQGPPKQPPGTPENFS